MLVFDVLDDGTRMLVACHAVLIRTAQAVVTAIRQAFTAHGVPAIVFPDNGATLAKPARLPARTDATAATSHEPA